MTGAATTPPQAAGSGGDRPARLRRGDRISLLGAVILIAGLLLPWYSVRVDAPDTRGVVRERTGISVYTALDGLDVLITFIAVGIVVLFVAMALGLVDPRLRIAALVGGLVAAAIAVLRLIDPPAAVGISVSASWGIVLALAGALVVIVGQFVGGGRAPGHRRSATPV